MTLNLKNAERKKAAAFSSWEKKDPRRSKYESLKHTLNELEEKGPCLFNFGHLFKILI